MWHIHGSSASNGYHPHMQNPAARPMKIPIPCVPGALPRIYQLEQLLVVICAQDLKGMQETDSRAQARKETDNTEIATHSLFQRVHEAAWEECT